MNPVDVALFCTFHIIPVSSTIVTDVIFPLVDGKIEFTDAKPILKVKGEPFHFTGDVLKKLKFKHYSNKLPKDFRNFHAFPKENKLEKVKKEMSFLKQKKFEDCLFNPKKMTQFKSMNIKQNFMKRKLAKVRKKKKKREKKLMVTKKCITEVISDFDIPFTSTSRLIPFFLRFLLNYAANWNYHFRKRRMKKFLIDLILNFLL